MYKYSDNHIRKDGCLYLGDIFDKNKNLIRIKLDLSENDL